MMRECPYCGRPLYGDNLHCQECIGFNDDDEDDDPYDPIADPDNYEPEGFSTIEEYNEFWEQFYESQNTNND